MMGFGPNSGEGRTLPTHLVNLDALIRREDLAAVPNPLVAEPVEFLQNLNISQLASTQLFFKMLRKPDYQRETAHWSPQKVAAFIRSYVEGDLIPAIILWHSNASGNVFVIDGAHRLSALIAYVHDDYGSGSISTPFFENLIAAEQKQAAENTRKIVRDTIGSYVELTASQSHATLEKQKFAGNLAAVGIRLQWVPGDALRAERSFYIINTQQTPIDESERRLIRDRKCANAIATRALIRAGTGHEYWSSFALDIKTQIKQTAKDVYDTLFVPPLEEPIKTLDLPVAGRGYSAESVRLILDFIEFVNKSALTSDSKAVKGRTKSDAITPTTAPDEDGTQTLEFLKQVKRTAKRLTGTDPASFGLHPAVYYYSATGKYQPTAFLASVAFVKDLEEHDRLLVFSANRYAFEEHLLKYKYFINEIIRKYGSGSRGLSALTRLYQYLFNGVVEKKTDLELVPVFESDRQIAFLAPLVDSDKGTKKHFTTERKSAAFLKEALDKALRCAQCNARLHKRSMQVDHIQRKREGGVGTVENAQLMHPYCNSTVKG